MKIMSLIPSLTCNLILIHEESNKLNRVIHKLLNQQMGNKLQKDGSNPGLSTRPGSDTILND